MASALARIKAFTTDWLDDAQDRLAAVAKAARVHVAKPLVAVGLPVLPLAIVLAFSDLGGYCNDHLYYEPLMKLRARMGLAPQLDDRVRLIRVEDSTLEAL